VAVDPAGLVFLHVVILIAIGHAAAPGGRIDGNGGRGAELVGRAIAPFQPTLVFVALPMFTSVVTGTMAT